MLGKSSKPAAGASPLSAWQPPAPPPALVASYLAEDIDPATGEVMSLITGIDPTDAALITQARTRRGSGASVLEDGHALDTIENATTDVAQRIRFELKRITDPFVARGEIEIVSMQIDAGEPSDMGAVVVVYRNTRTGKEGELTFLGS